MSVEMTLNHATKIAVINGKAYQAYAWYGNSPTFFLAVAGKTPLTMEDIGNEYYIVRQGPLYVAFRRAYFPFISQLVDEVREKQIYAYCAIGLTEAAVTASFNAQMASLAADPAKSLTRCTHVTDSAGIGPDALMIEPWRITYKFAQPEQEVDDNGYDDGNDDDDD